MVLPLVDLLAFDLRCSVPVREWQEVQAVPRCEVVGRRVMHKFVALESLWQHCGWAGAQAAQRCAGGSGTLRDASLILSLRQPVATSGRGAVVPPRPPVGCSPRSQAWRSVPHKAGRHRTSSGAPPGPPARIALPPPAPPPSRHHRHWGPVQLGARVDGAGTRPHRGRSRVAYGGAGWARQRGRRRPTRHSRRQ